MTQAGEAGLPVVAAPGAGKGSVGHIRCKCR